MVDVKTIKLLADRVLIKPSAADSVTIGGIIIPDTAKEKPHKGLVVAVGPGKQGKDDEKMTLKIDDFVLYNKYGGSELTIDEQEYIIMRETDIIAIL